MSGRSRGKTKIRLALRDIMRAEELSKLYAKYICSGASLGVITQDVGKCEMQENVQGAVQRSFLIISKDIWKPA
jgi:hypothetical protein